MDFFKVLIIIICLLIVAGCMSSIVVSIRRKNVLKQMYVDVEKLLESMIDDNNKECYSLNALYTEGYDYEFITPECNYYIKVIPNLNNQEICVNNAIKWQLRKSYNDETLRFVPDVEGLMRLEVDSNKQFKKVYIIYPNARSLLKYINECEMVFVHPDTDVYGTNIIPYLALKEKPELLSGVKEI